MFRDVSDDQRVLVVQLMVQRERLRVKAIAARTGVSEKTVLRIWKRYRQQLGAKNGTRDGDAGER